jgi:hypothetical protein
MQISVTVNLDKGETLAYAPDAAAMQVLVALGGNAAEDYCTCYVYSPNEPGEAGTPPVPPSE